MGVIRASFQSDGITRGIKERLNKCVSDFEIRGDASRNNFESNCRTSLLLSAFIVSRSVTTLPSSIVTNSNEWIVAGFFHSISSWLTKLRGNSMSYFGKIFIKTVDRYAMITADIFLFISNQFVDLFPHHSRIIFDMVYGIIKPFFSKSDGSVNIISSTLVLFPQGLIFTWNCFFV